MKRLKAFWTVSALLPATIIPLATNTSCSQNWGYKTPISIGSTVKGDTYDPYINFKSNTDLVDLNGNAIVPQLQSNYAVDIAHTNYYGYSLPEKWDANNTTKEAGWKGAFVEGSAAWCDYSSSAFVKSGTRVETKEKDAKSEIVYSYRNNMLGSNIELVSLIATTMDQYFNYALQYQGTQVGKEYVQSTEDNTNLAIAWGGKVTHGLKTDDSNRLFMEQIFAANAVSGTAKTQALLRPTHVQFEFKDGYFPIVSYAHDGSQITGVNKSLLKLLNGEENKRPSEATDKYWAQKQDGEEYVVDKEGKTHHYNFTTYQYLNVPVIVSAKAFAKSYVNPTINGGFMVSDFYPEAKTITDTVNWDKATFEKFADGEAKPKYSSFILKNKSGKSIEPKCADQSTKYRDRRIANLKQNDFIVLLNYVYKEYTKTDVAGETNLERLDRATMSGLSTVVPAYICDKDLNLASTFFVKTTAPNSEAYIFDTNVLNSFTSQIMSLLQRTSKEGLKPEAKDLGDTSKKLLKFLAYMYGDNADEVKIADVMSGIELK